MQSLACCTLQRSRNCSPADADVIHYTEDKFKTVVGSDLLLCLIVLKTNAMQSALCSTLLIYLKVTTAQICLAKFLCRKDFLVCSLKTKEKRNGHTWDLILHLCFIFFSTYFMKANCSYSIYAHGFWCS